MGVTARMAAMLVALALLSLPAGAGKIKRYTDDEGTLHIIDSEPANQGKAAPGTAVTAPPAAIPSFPTPMVQPPEEPEPPAQEGTEEAPEEVPAEQEEAPGA